MRKRFIKPRVSRLRRFFLVCFKWDARCVSIRMNKRFRGGRACVRSHLRELEGKEVSAVAIKKIRYGLDRFHAISLEALLWTDVLHAQTPIKHSKWPSKSSCSTSSIVFHTLSNETSRESFQFFVILDVCFDRHEMITILKYQHHI